MTGPTLTLTASGIVTFTDEHGNTGNVPELVQRLRRVGAAPDDVQAVLLLAGAVRSQARLLRRLDVLAPLAGKSAIGAAALDIVNMKRGLPRATQSKIRHLAETLRPRYKSDRSLHAAIARQTALTDGQVRQVLKPPQRKSR